ncbi:MAG TPA: HDOD domain-containing protein [Verrucomicrobiae bacterium]|nr:HDOD domain-containing protein [Verrucomicrobiae bacterium]
MKTVVEEALRSRIRNLDAIPSIPAVLAPLLRCLELPSDQVEVEKITELVSYDKSIAAQCLRMANSPLFAPGRPVETIRGAVIALGSRRLRDILWSSFLIRMAPKTEWPVNPVAFWEHSFGCAIVTQQLARKVGCQDPEKAYLCGLLHDIGELVYATVLPAEFRSVVDAARARNISLYDAELELLGFTHADTGSLLADYWSLPPDVKKVVEFHHAPELAPSPVVLPALVHLSDLLCRMQGMGYGIEEMAEVDFLDSSAWRLLQDELPQLGTIDIARFTLELDAEAEEVRRLVASVFQV